jgi:hypothetical protein
MSTAEQQRKWRASKGARTGVPGRPITAECGTVSAYKRHRRKCETVDAACANAWAVYMRERHKARKQG